MARAYPIDVRERVVAAVEREGLSRHEAARFGVVPSSAIEWVLPGDGERGTGPVRRAKAAGVAWVHGDWLLERSVRDFKPRGLVVELAERGVKVDCRQVWEFVHAQGMHFKMRQSSGE